jgi:hypothetical protein
MDTRFDWCRHEYGKPDYDQHVDVDHAVDLDESDPRSDRDGHAEAAHKVPDQPLGLPAPRSPADPDHRQEGHPAPGPLCRLRRRHPRASAGLSRKPGFSVVAALSRPMLLFLAPISFSPMSCVSSELT